MKAPDKIYLIETTRICDEWRESPSKYATNIAYIRKDALLEWARNYHKLCESMGTRAMQKAFDEIIDKIKSL